MKRKILALFALLCVCLCLTGCSKDRVIRDLNRLCQAAGELILTRDSQLQGDRDFGGDSYVGTYTAEYDGFDGFERLFGGTSLERKKGDSVELRCSLTVEAGEVELLFRCGAEEDQILLDESGEICTTLALPAGGNYICLKGENFSGSVQLELA